ncbi:MAG: 16S rRNA (uracil(1498)-N(3))-methyltransferase [Acidobacteria bacterium]|nr:16S rRNA (uracil(1498)-N(3))-methyltransferase [Acidobacteriota bacterium]
MQRHRFHAPPGTLSAETIDLDAAESHHLARVLRLRAGDVVFAFDGEGREWECEVAASHHRSSRLAIRRQLEDTVESALDLTLAQALTRGDRFDLIVQKATELGVTRIIPVSSEHAETRKSVDRTEPRLERWQRISLEALKQCGRRRLVTITGPVPFPALCQELSGAPAVIFSERGGRPFPTTTTPTTRPTTTPTTRPNRGLTLVVGPEGGWSEAELSLASTHGLIPVHLGPRILRTETAAIAAVTIAQFLCGDLSPS